MENKSSIPLIKVNIQDIKTFLKKVGGFRYEDIEPIYMGVLINEKEKWSQKIAQLPKDKRYLIIQSNRDETINTLTILFYRQDKCGQIIGYKLLTLILCKNSKQKLYFESNSRLTEIEVIEEKVNRNENKNFESNEQARFSHVQKQNSTVNQNFNSEPVKKNKFAFSDTIFFGTRIDHLIYTIYKNNEKFIDFNDAKNGFEFLFCSRNSKDWHIDITWYSIDLTYSKLYNFKTEIDKINEHKIFIRHKNYENENLFCLESGDYTENSINALPKHGYVEIDLKENNDKTGFKYKLTDCNGNLISYAIDDNSSPNEHSKLDKYLNKKYKPDELKNFLERFNLSLANGNVVLPDKAKGFYFTDYYICNGAFVCLGTETKLTFTKEFLNELEKCGRLSSKFYVLPKSQAFEDILNFIAETKLVPCGELFFINEEIVKSYDIEKHIEHNIDEKDMPKLCIDDLTKVSKIDDDFACVLEVFKKIEKKSGSDFKTDDIRKILEQVRTNAANKKKDNRSNLSNLKENVDKFETLLLRYPKNQQIKSIYEKARKKLEEIKAKKKNGCPNQESQINYEK